MALNQGLSQKQVGEALALIHAHHEEAKRLTFATPSKDAETIARFADDLRAHGGDAEAIQEVSMDLSAVFQKGGKEHLPNAQMTFDRFHLMKLVNTLLKVWGGNAKASGLPPLVKVAYTVMNHWDGFLRWFDSHITNGILEGFNLLQSAKSKARG